MKVLVLVDGEHYPPVTRWAIDELARAWAGAARGAVRGWRREARSVERPRSRGPPAAIGSSEAPDRAGRSATRSTSSTRRAIFDLSDEPVLGYRERMELAAVALARGVPYLGAGLPVRPADRGARRSPSRRSRSSARGSGPARRPSSGEVAPGRGRARARPGRRGDGPRGTRRSPRSLAPGRVTLDVLLELVRAATPRGVGLPGGSRSTSGVTTVGARRAGGGLAGRPAFDQRARGGRARGRAGSPDRDRRRERRVGADRSRGTPASSSYPSTVPPEYLGGYLGPFRLLLSDLVVVTMAGSPAGLENIPTLRSHVERLNGDARLIVTDFEPQPLGDVRGQGRVLHHDGAGGGGRETGGNPRANPRMPRGRVERAAGRSGRPGAGPGRRGGLRGAPYGAEGRGDRRSVRPGDGPGRRGGLRRQPRRRVGGRHGPSDRA